MPIDLENDSTLSDALAKLEAAEAAAGDIPKEHFVQADAGAQGEAGEQATARPTDAQQPEPGTGEKAQDRPVTDDTTDTPAAADEPADKEATPEKPADAGSKFAKDRARRDESWKALNAEKEAFKAEKTRLEAERAEFQREREAAQAKAARSQQRYTPEQYEQAAQRNVDQASTLELQAKGLEAQVREFEEDGKYTEAESAKARARELREQAAYSRGVAKQLKEHATQVRNNPDPTVEQLKAKSAAALREYTLAAAKEWPDLLKENSPFQQAVARNIQEARKAGLDENEFPVVRYHAAKMAALETAVARVPVMEKELAKAQARVKELEALTSPGGGQAAVQGQPGRGPKSDADEAAELRAEAARYS